MTERHIGMLWVMLAAAGYSLLPIFTRAIYTNVDFTALDIALWRFIVATPVIWLALLVQEHFRPPGSESRRQIFRALSMGLIYAGAALTAFIALQYIPASMFIVLAYTYPALVALMALLRGQQLTRTAWIALALTLAGVFMTVPDLRVAGDNIGLGILVAFLNAFMIASYVTIVPGIMRGSGSIMRVTAWVITGTLIVLAAAIPFTGFTMPNSIAVWALLLGLGIFSTAMPILTLNIGVQKIGPTTAAIISSVEPLLTLLLALLLLDETLLLAQWIGAAFIIAGVLVLEVRPRRFMLRR